MLLTKCRSSRPEVFSCEFCEIFKNTFFTEHLRTTASVNDFAVPVQHSGKFHNKTV